MSQVAHVLGTLIQVYSYVLLAYIVLTWFPPRGWVADVRSSLDPLVEPYLSLFRRVIPPISGVDFSPILAFIVLSVIRNLVYTLLV